MDRYINNTGERILHVDLERNRVFSDIDVIAEGKWGSPILIVRELREEILGNGVIDLF